MTSALWVGAYVRRCQAEGAIATVARHGADEAGAIFVIVDRLNGSADLYGPAPQAAFTEPGVSDRLFQCLVGNEPRDAIASRLEREAGFDPDLWIVDVEDRDARVFFDIV